MDYKIREIKSSDDLKLFTIIQNNLKKYHLDIKGSAYYDPQLSNLSTYYQANNNRLYLVAVSENDDVIGGIGLEVFDGFKKCCEMQKFYVDEKMQGQGIGTNLLIALEQVAKQKGFEAIYLETHSNLKQAINLYNRFNYELIDKPKNVIHSSMDLFYYKKIKE